MRTKVFLLSLVAMAIGAAPTAGFAQGIFRQQPRTAAAPQTARPVAPTAAAPAPQPQAAPVLTFSCKAGVTCYFATVGRAVSAGGELNFAIPAGSVSPIYGIRVGEHYLVSAAPTNGNRTLCAAIQRQGAFCFEKVVHPGDND